jgi:hypothetical protein
MSILSIGSHGAATKILALQMIQTLSDQFICFTKVDAGISIQVPLIGQPLQPVVPVQEPKHARKPATKQLLSGARNLLFGNFFLNISQLAEYLGDGSPLDY